MIEADAGTGKTTMIEMLDKTISTVPKLYLCFQRSVADEVIEEKKMKSTTAVRTFNGMGHRIWADTIGKKLNLNKKKIPDILRSVIDEIPKRDRGPIWDSFWSITNGVGMAKGLGYIPEGKFTDKKRLADRNTLYGALDEQPDDLTADLIDEVLLRSIKAAYAGNIDYNDQVYMPAVFGGIYPKYPEVFVDEYQDLNPTNHAMLDRLAKRHLTGVGDPAQNIFGFRGAKADGMEEAKAKFKMVQTTLSYSFRCPKEVVMNARWRKPGFNWIKEGGHVEHLDKFALADFPDSCAVICRNNAPLFKLAFRLLASGRSVRVAGSDIGPRLVALLRRICDDDMSQASMLSAIDDWLSEKIAKGSTTAQDDAQCMKTFVERGTSLGTALAYMDHLFKQSGTIHLTTGHKAKGLQWPTVFHLDQWLIRKDDPQDLNLKYVIDTRAEQTLYYVDSQAVR